VLLTKESKVQIGKLVINRGRCGRAATHNRTNDVSTSIIIVLPRTSYSNTVVKRRKESVSSVVYCEYASDQDARLTCHEAALATSCGILALPELMHRGREELCRARTRDIEAAAVTSAMGLSGVWRGLFHLVTRIGKSALASHAGTGRKVARLVLSGWHVGRSQLEEELGCVRNPFEAAVL